MDESKQEQHDTGGRTTEEHGGDGGGGGGGMVMRGVSRPIAERQIREHQEQGDQKDSGKGDSGEMDHEQRLEKLRMHHKQTLWIPWTLLMLGVWMVLAPFTLGYGNEALWVAPSGGRGVWLSDRLWTELRATLMTWSDILSGLLLIFFGWRALTPNRPKSWWICCFVGIWLSFAPLIFWAPTAAAYLNNTLVGVWVIALTVLIPGMPNMIMYMKMGPPTPPGWSYNPSSWPQRWIMIALGFAGWVASRYLGAFQLGYIGAVWDPFFGSETQRVLNSNLSHTWPISDAALGTFAYTFEFLMGWMGAPSRWRTMPWMVTFFGILVIPLGMVHIALVISQPVVVGAWCTICLLTAAIMLPMIPLEVDEVIAMGQHLVQSRRRGESLWKTFWKGGPAEGSEPDERTPELISLPQQPAAVIKSSVWGMSIPWTLAVAAILGIWMMFAPWVFGMESTAADIAHLGGALVVVVAVISWGEVVRAGRFLNGLLGLAIAVVPWVVDGASTAGAVNALIVGIAVALLALPRGPKTETYGLWDRYVF